MQVEVDDLSGDAVRALLAAHLDGMRASSPPDSVHALDLSALQTADMTVWTCRDQGEVLGVGALKQLSEDHGEIKSMRTDSRHLRKGVGLSILEQIIAEARSRGYRRLSLETGSGEEFEPALQMYRKRGFRNGPAFADYRATDFNQFLHMDL
ncbi:putative acetyltransferase [Parasphingorhabdus marina DSM 22363]|uniref:Putative acetyltransferase n=1 Tax=Parasphingorhabdus marina DSM 22363 TaxID=1123272 RepID=A0A1N6F0A9_9SPHN|nr:GNAT family N-acetyltransferase [Parasphingorhabdus marina]SIN88725.1 putative acetyltransferase [Parasphingorhabdus marina DSM 22363]